MLRFSVLLGLVAVLGCTRGADPSPRGTRDASESSGASGGTAAQGPSIVVSGGSNPGDGAVGALSVEPLASVVTAITGEAPPTVSFQAKTGGVRVAARWAIDRGEIGEIDAEGLFTASGKVGGTARVTAEYAELSATTTVTVALRTIEHGDPAWSAAPPPAGPGGYQGVGGDGPGGAPTPAQVSVLDGSPASDSAVSVLYPYDRTVFPQGLLAPLLQWDPAGHAFDALLLHVTSEHYEYKGYFAANGTPFVNLPIPQAAWEAMTRSSSGQELTVSLVLAEGEQAFGPYTSKWIIAPAELHGTIYYNSYGTSYVTNSNDLDAYAEQYGAGTLGIAPGATEPTLSAGIDGSLNGEGCRVCHTVSGDGSLLVTQGAKQPGYSDTVALNLTADSTGGAGVPLSGVPSLTFPALSRDGKLLLSSAGGFQGDSASRLYAMPEAVLVSGVTGLPGDLEATLPAMSPDGKHVSFNFWEGSLSSGATTLTGDRASLAVLDFDGVSAFSNPRLLFTPPPGSSADVAVTFSSFLPDSSGVVFALQLGNPSQFWGYTWGENTSELWWVDLATAQARRLDALNGYGPSGDPYLPDNSLGAATHSAAQDATLNYEPTVSPIAAGGYAWVVFTTRRMYGNVAAELGPWESDPRRYPWREQVTSKKLWVAAIDLNAEPGSDPSHPAFYLPAQELYAGNSRGFWSLDPCRQDGQSCETGVQCCGGYCQHAQAGLVCGSDTTECAALYDRCTIDADCCDAPLNAACINSVCTAPEPPLIR